MNKAFVREPDVTEPYCPTCQSVGEPVRMETVIAQVGEAVAQTLDDSAFFCPAPSCPVVYFNSLERVILASSLLLPRYPKDSTAPLCPCFGLSLDDVEEDIYDGVPKRIRALLAQSNSPEAACLTKSLTGRCCLPEVQKIYFRRLNELRRGT